jgi:hypothetical protein
MLDPEPTGMLVDPHETLTGAPPPSSLQPTPSKKRRVTISGAPHPLNTDVRIPSDQTNSTPISPVVIGLSIQRDDPAALEQVRSMLTVKQKQKALIEQRRGSVAGILSTGEPATASDDRHPVIKTPVASRAMRRSPNPGSVVASATRRGPPVQGQSGPSTAGGPPSPGPMIVPSHQQQHQHQQQQQQPQPLPSQMSSAPSKGTHLPPPISFARRRAGQFGAGKKKPADIVISPRESHTQEQLQPAIQSAPPVLLQGQGQFHSGFPMALPRLPSIVTSGGEATRRPPLGQVPPTPSRFSLQRNAATSSLATQPSFTSSFAARSPPASVAIATSLVPPTPTSLHHPGYSGDKSAFLAPFGVFYDALNDSKQLKTWLGEQMHKSNLLLQTLSQQQEKMDELVESLVERKTHGMREEIVMLHRRVEELEDALRIARSEMIVRRQSVEVPVAGHRAPGKQQQQSQVVRNGVPVMSETYTFPPVSAMDRRRGGDPANAGKQSPPGWRVEWRGERGDLNNTNVNSNSLPGSENGSPAPYSTRRLSISAMRLDPPVRGVVGESSSSSNGGGSSGSFGVQSPPQTFREGPGPRHSGHPVLHSPPLSGKSGSVSLNSTPVLGFRSTHAPGEVGVGLHRQQSNPRLLVLSGDRSGSPMDDD